MLLLLREDVAEGRWVGVAADGAIVTGHAALARTRAGGAERDRRDCRKELTCD